jgi:nucleotide-binding universal stress UspA family protein
MHTHTIVVGVDGSDASKAALRWAAAEARLRGARLLVVHAWMGYPPMTAGTPVSAEDWAVLRKGAEEVVAGIVADVLADCVDLAIETTAVHGPAGRVLVEAAEDADLVADRIAHAIAERASELGADLVVVGSRGLGGFRGLLLGSVGHHITQHASCPAVVVHGSEAHAGEPQALEHATRA